MSTASPDSLSADHIRIHVLYGPAKMIGYSLNVAITAQVIRILMSGLGTAPSGNPYVRRAPTSTWTPVPTHTGYDCPWQYRSSAAPQLVASYLTRTLSSSEPEFSLLCAKAPNQFLREIHVFKLDHGHEVGHAFDSRTCSVT
jgi:hypothetical protein